jgi:hypothetical protein
VREVVEVQGGNQVARRRPLALWWWPGETLRFGSSKGLRAHRGDAAEAAHPAVTGPIRILRETGQHRAQWIGLLAISPASGRSAMSDAAQRCGEFGALGAEQAPGCSSATWRRAGAAGSPGPLAAAHVTASA